MKYLLFKILILRPFFTWILDSGPTTNMVLVNLFLIKMINIGKSDALFELFLCMVDRRKAAKYYFWLVRTCHERKFNRNYCNEEVILIHACTSYWIFSYKNPNILQNEFLKFI